MFRATASLVAIGLCACSFPRPEEQTGPAEADARPSPDAPSVDGPPNCAPGFVDLCGLSARQESLTTNGVVEINSELDGNCQVKPQAGGREICILYFAAINIPSNSTLLIYGRRPVALASATTFTIGGTLDVSSRRSRLSKNGAGSEACPFSASPQNDLGGGGGGAGGSFATRGGNGGIGDLNENGAPNGTAAGGVSAGQFPLPTLLRGGCSGQNGGAADGLGGAGAPAGGGVYLFAQGALSITGRVEASGAGGQGGAMANGGGGGAGSGGMIVLESDTQISVSGLLLATGGGGGEGAALMGAGLVGGDPESPTAAAGGAGRVEGGNGGNGATSSGGVVSAATNGQNEIGGGGGGGGGNGFILVRGPNRQLNGTFAPTPIQP